MRYWQCSKCKSLDTSTDNPAIGDIIHDDRRMRELTVKQYDHEVIQRNYVDSAGPIPSETDLMTDLNI